MNLSVNIYSYNVAFQCMFVGYKDQIRVITGISIASGTVTFISRYLPKSCT